MAKHKTTRKELLKSPDEFMTLSSRAITFFAAHVRELKIVGIVIGSLALIYLGGHAYFRYTNNKGQEAYNKAFYAVRQVTQGAVNPDNLVKAETMFQRVVDDYGLSKAAKLALPQVAYAKFVNGRYDDAIALYREFLDRISDRPEYASLTKLALAGCYEGKGDLKTAQETLTPLYEQQDNPFRETAMVGLARLYRMDNRTEEEKKVLREFIESFPDSPFVGEAKARL
ncbi:MAG: tetratricopeptide repeat protein [Deltaproteobacteria bacterium]|nr:tetratricopeptide repeat protein [Deltaproteobacteria bacterium]